MILAILQKPNPVLRQIAPPVDLADPAAVEIMHANAQDLRATFDATRNAAGLAGPQLGIMSRMVIVDASRTRGDTYLMVNPVITKASEQLRIVLDGCLSVEKGTLRYYTKRPARIVVEWYTEHGVFRRQKFAGLIAAVIHHELDHLNGRLFTDLPKSYGSPL